MCSRQDVPLPSVDCTFVRRGRIAACPEVLPSAVTAERAPAHSTSLFLADGVAFVLVPADWTKVGFDSIGPPTVDHARPFSEMAVSRPEEGCLATGSCS